MKQGKTLTELAAEVQRQQESKRDFIVPMRQFGMNGSGQLRFGEEQPVEFTKHAHNQLATFLDIPVKYYDKMRQRDAILLQTNVNAWLNTQPDTKKMVRMLDGMGRAFLSSRYRRLDYADMLEAVLPIMANTDIEIVSSDVTERKLYLKAVFPDIQGEVKKGDVVQSGIVLSNSEIGCGGVNVQPLLYRLACLNGMIMQDSSIRKYHIGKNFGGAGVEELLTSQTRTANDIAFWMSVRDVVKASFNEVHFKTHLTKLQEAAGVEIESKNVEKVVEVTNKKFGISEENGHGVLSHLIKGGDLTKWGLSNAVTATANDIEDYETATELERIGGEIIDLGPHQWNSISMAS